MSPIRPPTRTAETPATRARQVSRTRSFDGGGHARPRSPSGPRRRSSRRRRPRGRARRCPRRGACASASGSRGRSPRSPRSRWSWGSPGSPGRRPCRPASGCRPRRSGRSRRSSRPAGTPRRTRQASRWTIHVARSIFRSSVRPLQVIIRRLPPAASFTAARTSAATASTGRSPSIRWRSAVGPVELRERLGLLAVDPEARRHRLRRVVGASLERRALHETLDDRGVRDVDEEDRRQRAALLLEQPRRAPRPAAPCAGSRRRAHRPPRRAPRSAPSASS